MVSPPDIHALYRSHEASSRLSLPPPWSSHVFHAGVMGAARGRGWLCREEGDAHRPDSRSRVPLVTGTGFMVSTGSIDAPSDLFFLLPGSVIDRSQAVAAAAAASPPLPLPSFHASLLPPPSMESGTRSISFPHSPSYWGRNGAES